MSEARSFVARAWLTGVGTDELAELSALASAPDAPDLALFGALGALAAGQPVRLPPMPRAPDAVVLHAVAHLRLELRTHDRAAIERAIDRLSSALDGVPPDHPNTAVVHAWADHALGELALRVGDLHVARRRFELVAAPDRPVALRIDALLQLVALAVERGDLEAARVAARRAAGLAVTEERAHDARRTRRVRALLDFAVADLAAMRETLDPGDPVERLLLATAEPSPRAFELFAEALREAVDRADPVAYALCVLLGARRYAAIGRDAEARATLDAGIAQLANIAPSLGKLLAAERSACREHDEAEPQAAPPQRFPKI